MIYQFADDTRDRGLAGRMAQLVQESYLFFGFSGGASLGLTLGAARHGKKEPISKTAGMAC